VQRWRDISSGLCGLAAAICLAAMMLLTVADVVLRAAFNAPIRGVPLAKRIALAFAVAILAVMAWQGWLAARDAVAFNDQTADLGLSRAWHWAGVLAGIVGAAVAALAMGLWGKDRR
jgi:TRAP-type C4-dicarboxylate transport system permease small subunit